MKNSTKIHLKPISITIDNCAFTITTRVSAVSYRNLLKNSRFPMSAVIYEYK